MEFGIINNGLQIQKKWPESSSYSQHPQETSDTENADFLLNSHLSSNSDIEYSLSAQQDFLLENNFTCNIPLQHIYNPYLSNYVLLQNTLLNCQDPFLTNNIENNTIPTDRNPISFYNIFTADKNEIAQYIPALPLNIASHTPAEYFEKVSSPPYQSLSAQQEAPLCAFNSSNLSHQDSNSASSNVSNIESSYLTTYNEYMRNLHEITISTPKELDIRKRIYTEKIKIKKIQKLIIELYKKKGITPEINAKIFNNISALKEFLRQSLKASKKIENSYRNEEFYKRVSSVIWFFIKNWYPKYKLEFTNQFKEETFISEKTIAKYINGLNSILININKISLIKNTNITQQHLPFSENQEIIDTDQIQDKLINKYINTKAILNTKNLKKNKPLDIAISHYIKYFIENINNINNDPKNSNKWHSKIIDTIKKNTALESSFIEESTFGMFNKMILKKMKGLILQNKEYGDFSKQISKLA